MTHPDQRTWTAGLEDLRQDIAGPFPRALLLEWLAGPRTAARADALLAPFAVEGTVVSSDSAGLTRLSASLDPVWLLALISASKELIHAVGRSAGGRAPGGPWIADNTQMIYPAQVPVSRVVAATVEMHERLAGGLIQVGFGLHHGHFYEIGGGLYGDEATLVEELAEEHTGGGETVLTRAALARCPGLEVETRAVPLGPGGADLPVEVLRRPPARSDHPPLDLDAGLYPLPFSRRFHAELRGLERHPGGPGPTQLAAVRQACEAERTVLFADFGAPPSGPPLEILETALRHAAAARVVAELLHDDVAAVENATGLTLLCFQRAAGAIDFARELCRRGAALGLVPRVGLESGALLVIPRDPLPEGEPGPAAAFTLSGMAVNLASKLAHELGQAGKIHVGERAAAEAGATGLALQAQVSGNTVRAVTLDPLQNR